MTLCQTQPLSSSWTERNGASNAAPRRPWRVHSPEQYAGLKTSFLVTHEALHACCCPAMLRPVDGLFGPDKAPSSAPNHREQNIMLFLFAGFRPIPAAANSQGCGLSFGAGLQSRQGG